MAHAALFLSFGVITMKEIFESQQQWFQKGYSKSVTYRETMLNQLKTAIKKYESELMDALFEDLGKHPTETYITELFMVYKSLDYAIKNVAKWSKDKRKRTPLILKPGKSYTRQLPYGNILIMGAYNYPLLLSVDPIIGAIAAGNTVMLALSSNSHQTNDVLIKLINETFESQYIYAFETNRTINEQVLTYPFDKIFFTGSKKVGKVVLKAASEHLTPVTLELGGKSPALVLRDANIKHSADNIMYSKVLNSGQTCVATDYVLVDHRIADEFIEALIQSLKTFYPSFDQYPKLINEQSYKRIEQLIVADEKYVVGTVEKNEQTRQIKPVLLKAAFEDIENVQSMKEEIFGPILPIIVFEDLNETLRYMADQETPLAMYVFGRRRLNVEKALVNVDSGGVALNSTIMHMVNQHLPFSGFRQSGMGSYHGKYSFDTFSYTQAVYKKTGFQFHKVIFPPYKNYFKK